MNEEVKALWVKALRSGKYQQGFGRLYRERKFLWFKLQPEMCPWGVLTDLYIKTHPEANWLDWREEVGPPVPVTLWLGEHIFGVIGLNDDKKPPFSEIADYIEKWPNTAPSSN